MTIKFMDHTPLHIEFLHSHLRNTTWKDLSKDECDIRALALILKTNKETEYNLCAAEIRWKKQGRPFFNIFPRVVTALSKTPLTLSPSSIPHSIVNDIGIICVKLPVGCEIETKHGVKWFFISIAPGYDAELFRKRSSVPDHPRVAVMVTYQTQDNVFCFSAYMDSTFDESNAKLPDCDESLNETSIRKLIARIALGVMMLAADPDYIKPVLLKADEGKTTPIEDRIAKARRRGVYGFTIGEDVERCPHFRRPHFAIRWTGKGGQTPRLVPVKGAVIGKEILTTVPTGYEEHGG
jgi:hypothetical protein